MPGSLDGRRVLVTGASSGIGEATARACAAAGAELAVVARRRVRLEALSRDTGAVPLAADLTDERAARDVVGAAADSLGGLDAVVNNAGIMRPGPVGDGQVSDWRAMFDLNVLALLVVTQAALPYLRRHRCADIVNLSSQSGRRVASAASGVYAATKFAVHALSEGLRLEVGADGVRVTVVSPGLVRSELLDTAPSNDGTQRLQRLQSEIGLPAEAVAEQVVHVLAQAPGVHLREVVVAPTAQST